MFFAEFLLIAAMLANMMFMYGSTAKSNLAFLIFRIISSAYLTVTNLLMSIHAAIRLKVVESIVV